MKLSDATLGALDPRIRRPAYDRSRLSPGIVHVGLGNFHRAHQAVYLDDLFALGRDHDWAIVGAGVRAPDTAMRAALLAQDCLSTVIEVSAEATAARIVGAMIGFLPVEPANDALIAGMAAPATRIVSLTVTEGGYFVDPATGVFDPSHPAMVADAANPGRPATVFGAIVAALAARRAAGQVPFTVMSCDNLPGNGQVTRDAVTGLAGLSDPALAEWIDGNVAFPDAMVDRITPATGARERAIALGFGLDDPVPVTCEPFRQWVLEDKFTAGRPRFEEAGVTISADVHSYERMKIRILNGGHAIIAYSSALMGVEFAHQAMAHPLVRGLLRKVEETEVLPHVKPVPDMSPAAYLDLISARFANPGIEDTTQRLCLDGSNRQPKFILPSVADGLQAGVPVEGLALVSALWARYCEGTTDAGAVTAPNDPDWDRLQKVARRARQDPAQWLGMTDIYGPLAGEPRFAKPFARWLRMLWQDGTAATLTTYLDRT